MSKKYLKVKKKLGNSGLPISSDPTCHVVIANGGLGNGVSVHQLSKLLQDHGKVMTINSSNQKSYACATFDLLEGAISAVTHLQEKVLDKHCDKQNKQATIYLFFLSSLNEVAKGDNLPTINSHLPPGLVLQEDFLTKEEELQLIKSIENDFLFPPSTCVLERLKHRTVLHYGYRFRYGSNDVDKNKPLSSQSRQGFPEYADELVNKLCKLAQVKNIPDQMTINKYEPGDGIASHIDNPTAFGEVIITVSLGSSVVMEMSYGDRLVDFVVKPRSVILFTEDARYKWAHGIRQKKIDVIDDGSCGPVPVERGTRISLTFRRTQCSNTNSEISCSVPNIRLPGSEEEAGKMEREYVHSVYNSIASHFSQTREKPWPRVVDFLSGLDDFSTVLDVGCGSGRYLNVCSNVAMFGCDYSQSLAEICQEKGSRTFICDGLNIPIRDSCFDACICIAVLHHLSTKERRCCAINELLRITKPGGKILIYVWAEEQTYKNKRSNYLKSENPGTPIDKTVCSDCDNKMAQAPLSIHKNRTNFEQQDILVPWKLKGQSADEVKSNNESATFYRYYHVFKQHELESLFNEIPQGKLTDSYYDNGNWAVVVTKDL